MKQKQRKITIAQVRALEQKLITLEAKRRAVMLRRAPLKAILRKYIQQNMTAIEQYLAKHGETGIINWAVWKIKRGYFGDANLKTLIEIVQELREVGLLERSN